MQGLRISLPFMIIPFQSVIFGTTSTGKCLLMTSKLPAFLIDLTREILFSADIPLIVDLILYLIGCIFKEFGYFVSKY